MGGALMAFLLGALATGAGATGGAQSGGRLMFVGTYTGPTSQGIYAFRFDDSTGALTPLGLAAETPNPSFLAVSPDRRVLFAVNGISSFDGARSGSVRSFTIDAATGKLSAISVQSTQGADPCHLAIDATGRVLAVANYTGGNFVLLPVTDGQLAPPMAVLAGLSTRSGPNKARQNGPHAHAVVFDPTNQFLVGADLGLDRLFVSRVNPSAARSEAAAPTGVAVAPGAGPRHFAFHPNGRLAYSINELDSTVTSFSWDAKSGTLTAGKSVSTLPAEGHPNSSTAEIAVHPTGRFLYGSNRGHDSIAAFAIQQDGGLTLIEHEPTRGQTPRNFTIDPTGRWLIAANQRTGNLAVFSIDQKTGALAPVGPLVPVGAPVCIVFVCV